LKPLDDAEQSDESPGQTFADSVLGEQLSPDALRKLRGAQPNLLARVICWLRETPNGLAALVAGLGVVLLVPYVGAVGLWDPWETHYGEVGRMMIQRNDYVYPYWESAWFYSKPALTMWIQALGMQIVGTNRTDGPVALYTEWGMRMPFALMSVLALSLLALAVARIVNRRAALASAFALVTMPLYFLLARQTVTDVPFIAAQTCAMACALIGQLDPRTKHRAAWWYGFYICCGISTLAKELMGFAVPAATLLIYGCLCVIRWNGKELEDHLRWLYSSEFRAQVRSGREPMPVLWDQFFKMRLGTGLLVFAAVTVPWYLTLMFHEGVDDEGKTFLGRLIHDNIFRLLSGVHTTTPGGTFTYFIEQGGYAIFPWVALVPGALAVSSRLQLRSQNRADHLGVIAVIWAGISFFVVAVSATKFHHYVLGVLPPLAILIGLFVDRLWEEGIRRHAISLILGLILFILVGKDLANNPKDFTDLFVYNYDRPYPTELVTQPLRLLNLRPLWTGDFLVTALIALGTYLIFDTFRSRPATVYARAVALLLALSGVGVLIALSTRGHVSVMLFVGLAVALVAIYAGAELGRGKDKSTSLIAFVCVLGFSALLLCVAGLATAPLSDPLLPMLMQAVNIKSALSMAFALAGFVCAAAALMRARAMLFSAFWLLAFGFALWFNWSHWVDLSHHWTQRDQFWRYYELRKPDEPIVAFMMNWRGETFYSKNTVKQIKDNARMAQYAALPGRKWALVEHNRLGILKNAVGADKTVTSIDRDLNVKFVLVTIE
jgi:4-amino-4-deoxy-L-arabinose transferase-like glycosyltransferase